MFLSVVLPFSSRFWLLAFCFGCLNREENGSTTLRNTREKPLLVGYGRQYKQNKNVFSTVQDVVVIIDRS